MPFTRRRVLKGMAAALGAAAAPCAAMSDSSTVKPDDEKSLRLWYPRPARQWLEALPIGNGRLGAMVFGGVPEERLQLNEGTVWAGAPHDYDSPEGLGALAEIRRLVFAGEWEKAQDLVNAKFLGRPAAQMPYQTVGSLVIKMADGGEAANYHRELLLDAAVANTAYEIGGVRHTRQVFASAPHQVVVLRFAADRTGAVSFTLRFDSPRTDAHVRTSGGTLVMERHGTGRDAVGFCALASVQSAGGSLDVGDGSLRLSGADSAVVLISIASSYRSWQDASGEAAAAAARWMDEAGRHPYEYLLAAHGADYRRLFHSVTLDLGSADAAKDAEAERHPTDERVARFASAGDPRLAALHFRYGRYLLISASRPGGQPATLQGLWNDSLSPPWGSKYTININTEMNYWPACTANLLECYEPLFRMLADLSVAGRRSASGLYGARGWMCHHNTDAWRGTAPVDGSFWGMWPSGGAWLCKSIWDHYEFTGDRSGLERRYPILRGAAEYFLDALVTEPTHGWLVTCPSVSPENAHHPNASICAGPTMDMQILRDLFHAVSRASERLGVDADLRKRVDDARARLAPMQMGKLGQLQEWLEDWDGAAPEQHHRHVSHLYGLFPSDQITRRATPELFAAARKSLEMRGDMATGWSLAWKINLWARLGDGDHAYSLLSGLLSPERTAPNLFDLHPPFQIDGNFGAVSGIAEMLLQSHEGAVHLLPALPSAWPNGRVTGLRARGGFVVDIAWRDGRLHEAAIRSELGGPCTVRYGDAETTLATSRGRRYRLNGELKMA